MANFFEEALARLHARLDADAERMNAVHAAVLQALHHILTNGKSAVDHDALLALAKELNGKADAALSAAQSVSASHDVKTAALDDIGAVMDGIGPKLDKIAALAPSSPLESQADGSAGASTVSAGIAP